MRLSATSIATVRLRVLARVSRIGLLAWPALLQLCGCGVNVQDGVGPRVPIPNVMGVVRRDVTPASGLHAELRTESGQSIASTTTNATGAYGFDVTSSGIWEIKIVAGRPGDFDSVTRPFVFQGPSLVELPPLDVFAYGAGIVEPSAGASAPAPSPVQPLLFRWTLPARPGVTARVQLFDYGGVAVWSLFARPVPYNVTNSPGEIGFPAGAELAALTTPSGFRKTPVPVCAGACTPK